MLPSAPVRPSTPGSVSAVSPATPHPLGAALTSELAGVFPGSAMDGPGVAAIRAGRGPAARGNVRPPDPLTDADIRAALLGAFDADGVRSPRPTAGGAGWCEAGRDGAHDDVFADVAAATLILEELPLRGGYVRVDVAVMTPGALHVYEIKSDRDRLDRLPEQMRLYNAVADRVTLIVGWPHAVAAMRRAPAWWEVWLAERGDGGAVALVPLREGGPNPEVCVRTVASLLSREAALSYLAELGADAGARSKPRDVLYARIDAALQARPIAPGSGAACAHASELAVGSTDLGPLRRRVHAYWCRRATRSGPAWSPGGG